VDEQIADDSPWLLTTPPTGYKASDFSPRQRFVDGNCCPKLLPPQGCSPVVYRYQGLSLSTKYAQRTGCSGPSLPAWYALEDGTHYLRHSYAEPASLWELKRATEIKAWYWAVGGLWVIQNNITNGKGWGFCNSSFPVRNPALMAQVSEDQHPHSLPCDVTLSHAVHHTGRAESTLG
jgi:hypothetical protein